MPDDKQIICLRMMSYCWIAGSEKDTECGNEDSHGEIAAWRYTKK